jgi:DNA-binding MarR family transcriptional regulator
MPSTEDDKSPDAYVPPEEALGFLLWDTSRAFVRTFSARIAEHGVSFGVFPYLRVLWEEDGLTQSELSDRVRMKGPTTVAAVTELERRGWVTRKGDPADRRKVNVFLTDEGRALHQRLMPAVHANNARGVRGLTAEQEQQLKDLLKHVRANILSRD